LDLISEKVEVMDGKCRKKEKEKDQQTQIQQTHKSFTA
jgi:hypothetical protein